MPNEERNWAPLFRGLQNDPAFQMLIEEAKTYLNQMANNFFERDSMEEEQREYWETKGKKAMLNWIINKVAATAKEQNPNKI